MSPHRRRPTAFLFGDLDPLGDLALSIGDLSIGDLELLDLFLFLFGDGDLDLFGDREVLDLFGDLFGDLFSEEKSSGFTRIGFTRFSLL